MYRVRTAAYCRVSTTAEEQEGSYEIQETYFRDLIESDPNKVLVGIYGDKGKSGLNTTGRPGLQKLLEDCRAGKIDLILSKSISRFSRRMSDCVEMIRELRNLGVSVYFERENINTSDQKNNLLLNIFAAIAEEESRSISQLAILAHKQHTLEGRPYGAVAFGYVDEGTGEHRWEINEEEAKKVRKAFQMASEEKCYKEILKALNEMESEGYEWSQQRLRYLLKNVVYKGDYYANKTVTLVPGQHVQNKGYKDRIYIRNHHEAIVPPEQFDRVQKLVDDGALNSRKARSRGSDVP